MEAAVQVNTQPETQLTTQPVAQLTAIELKKEKQLDLIKFICKTCFNNNVHDNIVIKDENTFVLTITKPHDVINISTLLFNLENTSVRDVSFAKATGGLIGFSLLFSTLNMISIGEEQFKRTQARLHLSITSPIITNITPNMSDVSDVDKLWITTTSEYLIKNLPIPMETGIVAFREEKNGEIKTWLHACLNQKVSLRELSLCISSVNGVKDIELCIENKEMQIKVYCGIERSHERTSSTKFKQQKNIAQESGQYVGSTKSNVRRIFPEVGMDKRQKQQRSEYVHEENTDEEISFE